MRPTLTCLAHGQSGVGKSWLGATAPAPRLVLDSEGRAKYLPVAGIRFWDPVREEPPVPDGTWDTCVVMVTEVATLQRVYQWLRSGQHYFVSVILDSLMEMQKRFIDDISGTSQLTQPNWGELLRRLEYLVRQFRDLTLVPDLPVQVVYFTVGTAQRDDGKYKPLLQGAMRDQLPYYLDVVGYMYVEPDEHQQLVRKMLIQPFPGYEAKDGTDELTKHYGPIITRPNLSEMLSLMVVNTTTTPEVVAQ